MSDIDWSKAPEGATHYFDRVAFPWLKNGEHPDYYHEDRRAWLPYGCAKYGREHIRLAVPRPTPQPEAHADDLAVDAFARAMSRRLAQCRAAGKSGWDDPEQCPPQRPAEGLVRAVRAGKLVDVGNYAMMLWKRADRAQAMARVPGWIGEALWSDAASHQGTPSLSDFIVVQPKAEPVEWDGTGLPPVGTMVEVHYSDQTPYEALVVAEHLGEVVLWIGNGARTNYWRCDPAWLRPILTPEQRAAKERDEAVAAMLADAGVTESAWADDPEATVWAQALYDAGYRKTEGE